MVNIDGVEYHKVLKSFTIDGALYAHIEGSVKPAITRIVDDANDTWHLLDDGWSLDGVCTPRRTREYIEDTYGIKDEY